jgi:hypothetical protein
MTALTTGSAAIPEVINVFLWQVSKVAERASVGIVLVIVAVLLWFADQRRLAIFVALALFVPYLAIVAPFKCGGDTRQRQACRLIGCGLLLGCHHHRFDRLGKIFGHDRDRAAARYRYPDRSVQAAFCGASREASSRRTHTPSGL